MRVAFTSFAVLLVIRAAASAQPAAQTGAAEAAFEKGLELRNAGDWKDACPAFEESQRIDPQFGTLYNVGECDQQLGKLASAWVAFRELAQRDTNTERRDHSAELARALEPRLSKLRITVKPDVPGTTVTMNGDDVTKLVGVELPVDPGTYEIAAVAPGRSRWTSKVEVVGEGKTVTVEATLPAPSPAPPPASPPVALTRPPPPAEHTPRNPRRIAGISSIALGGALLVGGFVAGGLARSKWDDAKALCSQDLTCANLSNVPQANGLADAARTRATASDVLLAVGVVAAGAGVYLFLSSRHRPDDATALRIAPSARGLTLLGGF